jgi:transposase
MSATIRLTEAERSRLQGMARRPRSRKQLYRAEALLALDEGRPMEEVARHFRVGIERVEEWIEGFIEKRLKYLDEPKGPKPGARQRGRAPGDDVDQES